MRISIALILVLGLAACEAEPPIVEPSPWIYEDDRDAVEPTLDGQEVAEAIEAAMAAMATIEPLPAYLRYEEIAQMGDAACPTRFDVYEDGQDTDYWIAECQADSGATFSGFAYRVEYDDAVADDMTLNGFVLQFSGRVDGPDGEFAQGSGALADVVGASDTYVYYQRVVDGSFAVDADAAAGTWLAAGLESSLQHIGYRMVEVDGARVRGISGGLSGFDAALQTVNFTDVAMGTAAIGGCPLEPSGTVSGRDADGSWYDVSFDGPGEFGQPYDGAGCDGCGEVWFRGEPAGQACVDFSGLLDWTEAPW
jgi:hypothetical protein